MTARTNRKSGVTALVLAGGDGERLRPFTERWLGRHVPKQYCTFAGTRSMLDHTLDRAACLCDPNRIMTVAGRQHRDLLQSRRPRPSDGSFLYQPRNLDTAPGVLFGLVHALHRDPDTTVVLFPSDHFVHPEWLFVEKVREAVRAVTLLPERMILLGATPVDLEEDYGWIVPAEELGDDPSQRLRAAQAFVEKPPPARAAALFAQGALWNTLVLVARGRTLWDVAAERLGHLTPYFTALEAAIDTSREADVLEAIYRELPPANFSSELLQQAAERIAVMPLDGVQWNDWGRPDRIVESLLAIGREPAFSLGLLAEPVRERARAAGVRRDSCAA